MRLHSQQSSYSRLAHRDSTQQCCQGTNSYVWQLAPHRAQKEDAGWDFGTTQKWCDAHRGSVGLVLKLLPTQNTTALRRVLHSFVPQSIPLLLIPATNPFAPSTKEQSFVSQAGAPPHREKQKKSHPRPVYEPESLLSTSMRTILCGVILLH